MAKMNDNEDISIAIIDLVKMIPVGRVTSYGAIARCLGTSGSARYVGWTLGKFAQKFNAPAHRVVNRNGLLTGRHHFRPPELMEQRLKFEGVSVVDNKVVDFEKVFWDPFEVLK